MSKTLHHRKENTKSNDDIIRKQLKRLREEVKKTSIKVRKEKKSKEQ